MADEADLANEQADRWLERALSAATSGPRLAPKGSCYFCDEPFDAASPDAAKRLFCDADCSADYEREKRLRQLR